VYSQAKKFAAFWKVYGFFNVRQKGSHVIMQQKTGGTTITVPVPNHSEIKIGTLLSIIRQSRLPRELFEA